MTLGKGISAAAVVILGLATMAFAERGHHGRDRGKGPAARGPQACPKCGRADCARTGCTKADPRQALREKFIQMIRQRLGGRSGFSGRTPFGPPSSAMRGPSRGRPSFGPRPMAGPGRSPHGDPRAAMRMRSMQMMQHRHGQSRFGQGRSAFGPGQRSFGRPPFAGGPRPSFGPSRGPRPPFGGSSRFGRGPSMGQRPSFQHGQMGRHGRSHKGAKDGRKGDPREEMRKRFMEMMQKRQGQRGPSMMHRGPWGGSRPSFGRGPSAKKGDPREEMRKRFMEMMQKRQGPQGPSMMHRGPWGGSRPSFGRGPSGKKDEKKADPREEMRKRFMEMMQKRQGSQGPPMMQRGRWGATRPSFGRGPSPKTDEKKADPREEMRKRFMEMMKKRSQQQGPKDAPKAPAGRAEHFRRGPDGDRGSMLRQMMERRRSQMGDRRGPERGGDKKAPEAKRPSGPPQRPPFGRPGFGRPGTMQGRPPFAPKGRGKADDDDDDDDGDDDDDDDDDEGGRQGRGGRGRGRGR